MASTANDQYSSTVDVLTIFTPLYWTVLDIDVATDYVI